MKMNLKVFTYFLIAILVTSCGKEKYDKYATNRISFVDEKFDSLVIEVDGPFEYGKLNSILQVNLDPFVYSTQNLYTMEIQNYFHPGILIDNFEQRQIYEDSTFVYTTMQKGEKIKKWYKSWRNPYKARHPLMKIDTLLPGTKSKYWFYLDFLEDGDSLLYFKTINMLDSSGIVIQFGGTIEDGRIQLLAYEE